MSYSTSPPPLPSPSTVFCPVLTLAHRLFFQAGRSTLSWGTTPSRCWRSSSPWWRCRAGCSLASPTSPTSPSSPTGASSASCPSTPWCGSGRPPTRWGTFPPRQPSNCGCRWGTCRTGGWLIVFPTSSCTSSLPSLSSLPSYVLHSFLLPWWNQFLNDEENFNCDCVQEGDDDCIIWFYYLEMKSRCTGPWCSSWQVRLKAASRRPPAFPSPSAPPALPSAILTWWHPDWYKLHTTNNVLLLALISVKPVDNIVQQ